MMLPVVDLWASWLSMAHVADAGFVRRMSAFKQCGLIEAVSATGHWRGFRQFETLSFAS